MTCPPAFLSSLLDRYDASPQSRPYVTLTFAQSLDSKIAGKEQKQLILSGKESMIMTHWMRTMHDSILIGIGTALNDDPQLNTRHLPERGPDLTNVHNNPYNLPRPIILDTHLRLPPQCKMLKNYKEGRGRRPWVVCTEPSGANETEWLNRRKALENAGARIVEIGHAKGHLPIPVVLETIYTLGIRSVMVEGGAQVIRSFLSQDSQTVDTIIVTVAPTFVGEGGVSYDVALSEPSGFKHVSTEMFGQDMVVALVPTKCA